MLRRVALCGAADPLIVHGVELVSYPARSLSPIFLPIWSVTLLARSDMSAVPHSHLIGPVFSTLYYHDCLRASVFLTMLVPTPTPFLCFPYSLLFLAQLAFHP